MLRSPATYDDIAGTQTAADRSRYVCDMAHDVDQFADVGFEVGRDGDIQAAAGDASLEPVEAGAASHRVARPEDHMALEDVAGEGGLYVVHRCGGVGELDGGAERRDCPADILTICPGWQIPADR